MIRAWQVVQCTGCHHIWDDENPEDEVCACIDDYGKRSVVVLSEGVTSPETETVAA